MVQESKFRIVAARHLSGNEAEMSEPVSEFEWLHFGARLETEAPEVARQLDILDELTREILLAEEVRPNSWKENMALY